MWELYAAVVLCAAESAAGPSTHFHSCVRQAASTHTSKENMLFRKLGDLSFVSAEFCPEPGRLWKSKTRRRRRDRGDATAHTWQWKVKARTCSSEVREIAADWRHVPSDTRRDHCNRAARCQQGLGWCLCFLLPDTVDVTLCPSG